MRKWPRRLSVVGATLAGTVLSLSLVLWILVRSTPQWYRPASMSPQQCDAAAQRATNKLVTVQNEAASVRAAEQAARIRPGSTLATQPASITISFTDDELNALVATWSVQPDFRAIYDRFMSDPYIVLNDGRMILAGRLKELNSLASLHFEPKMDGQGRLNLALVKTLAGNLPLPTALAAQYEQKATNRIAQQLAVWRRQASIDPSGIANDSAISATLGKLLMDVLQGQSADPILFLPLVDHGSIPVRVSGMSIQDHTLTLIVQPMGPDERGELVRRIREGK